MTRRARLERVGPICRRWRKRYEREGLGVMKKGASQRRAARKRLASRHRVAEAAE